MSSFKKLRLDPEAPVPGRNLSTNQPGASDSGGRGYVDSSSFSSSTSGGSSSTYMRNAGPFRTRYSLPLRIPSPSSSSFSRFAPYYFGKERRSTLRVPLIRARRDESDSEGCRPSSRASLNSSLGADSTTASVTTSTAQRIIETLQNLSTPVMNAGKIRIDQDIKAVQPLPFGSGSPLLRYSPGSSLNNSTGPPKMCSSLLLSNPSPANQISPVSNLGDQRRLFFIPKLIDAATNTGKESEAISPSHFHKSNKFGTISTEFRPSPVPPTSSKSFFDKTPTKPLTTSKDKDDNSDDEFHECSSEFTFSSAWSPEIYNKYFSNEKSEKSSEKKISFATAPPIMNGYKEAIPNTVTATMTAKGSAFLASATRTTATSANNSGFTGFNTGVNLSFGASPLKTAASPIPGIGDSDRNQSSRGLSEIPKADTVQTITAPSSGSHPQSTFKFGSQTSSSGPVKTFSFGTTSTSVDKPKEAPSFDKVDAATNATLSAKSSTSSTLPMPTLPPLTVKASGSKWRCPTCSVDNETTVLACVCCSEKNPNPSVAKLTAPDKKGWNCPTCLVDNKLEATACVCCSEKNPSPVPATVSAKKWKCPTCMVENDPAASTCPCCSEKNPNMTALKKDESSSAPAPAPAFKFGIVSSAGAPPPPLGNNTFSFGQSSSSDAPKSALPNFKFGAPTTTAPPSTTPTISCAATNSTPSSLPSKNPQATNISGPFNFGTASPSTTLNAAAPSPSFGFPTLPSSSSKPAVTTSSSIMFGTSKPATETTQNAPTPAAGSIFGSGGFQSTPQTLAAPSFNFGQPVTTTSSSEPQKTAPSFQFGASAGAKPSFGAFSFGSNSSSQQNPQVTQSSSVPPSILTSSVSTPTPALGGSNSGFGFGSSIQSASPFGQIQPPANPTPQHPSTGMFNFGGPPSNLSSAPTSNPSFSLAPNLNFGATAPGSSIPQFGNPTQPTPNAASQPPSVLFQFSATPSESPGGRKIKKAVRRFNK